VSKSAKVVLGGPRRPRFFCCAGRCRGVHLAARRHGGGELRELRRALRSVVKHTGLIRAVFADVSFLIRGSQLRILLLHDRRELVEVL
jgi:hypothetical protein